MKSILPTLSSILLVFLCNCGIGAGNLPHVSKADNTDDKVVVAYVTSWTDVIPDASTITHLNYAFGHVDDSFSGVRIDNEPRFKELSLLKRQNPHLKFLLSIGGWGSGRFSEMAASDSLRNSFSEACAEIIDNYGIDGIDIDWEYPGSDAAGISSSDSDRENFTKLMHALREKIGPDKLLTIASSANADYIEYKDVIDALDFVNIMTYDMSNGDKHHAALYPSDNTPYYTVSTSVEKHLEKGVPQDKIVVGMPFYGRGLENNVSVYRNYKDIILPQGFETTWDPVARAPFITDESGNFYMGFDSPQSIKMKCEYIKENGFKGAMYWEYGGDDSEKTLSKTVYNELIGN